MPVILSKSNVLTGACSVVTTLDKAAGTGASPAQVREDGKTRELHQAYALIRERRGF